MSMSVRAKKHLGQHFLKDEDIARRIADTLTGFGGYRHVLEIGPGMGVLTRFLLERPEFETWVVEIDLESVVYLQRHFPALGQRIVADDFLQMSLHGLFPGPFAVIGNFPYNISTQILFRVLENKELIPEFAGMFQREVAQRVCSGHGTKDYGILSVLLQVFYEVEYLFTVDEHVFHPPPQVKSGVMRMQRKPAVDMPCPEAFFKQVVKAAFNQRRKAMRNSLKLLGRPIPETAAPWLGLRPEQVSPQSFMELAGVLYNG